MNSSLPSIGDKVAYSAQFLKSTGIHSGPIPAARGKITAMESLSSIELAVVDWKEGNIPVRVNRANLAKVGPNARFALC